MFISPDPLQLNRLLETKAFLTTQNIKNRCIFLNSRSFEIATSLVGILLVAFFIVFRVIAFNLVRTLQKFSENFKISRENPTF